MPPVSLSGSGQPPTDAYSASLGGPNFVPGPTNVGALPDVANNRQQSVAFQDDYDPKDEDYRRVFAILSFLCYFFKYICFLLQHLEERIAASDSYSEKWKHSRRREAILQEARVTQQMSDGRLSKPPSRLEPLSSPQTSALGMPRSTSRKY